MKKYYLSFLLLFSFCISILAQEQNLIILQTSDVHSRVEPLDQKGDRNYDKGGMVRRATFLKDFRKDHPDVLLFDCGDISQGTPYYNEFQGEVEIKLMNEMKYDAMTIGNHEFDFDLPNMARLFKMANFPVVCSNYDVSATVLKDLVKPYIIIERSGAKIGVLGLGAKLEGLVQATKCVGVIYNDPVQAANDVAAKLKEQGCDAVVCLSHLGVEYDRDELIPQTRNIDIVLGGHSHTFMQEPENTNKNLDGRIVPLLHTGANGIYVGKVELPINKKQ